MGNDDDSPMRKVTGGLVPAALWKQVMTVAEQGLPPRPLDRTPESANVSESLATDQVSYVDDVDSATPQLPQDEAGDLVSGSGVMARDERRDAQAPAPSSASSYPHVPPSSAEMRPVEQTQRQAGRDVEPSPPADPPRETPSSYPTRQAAETPSYYRPWPQVPPTPYQAYRDRPDPPAYPYYSAPRAYYPAPSYADPRYDDARDRYNDR